MPSGSSPFSHPDFFFAGFGSDEHGFEELASISAALQVLFLTAGFFFGDFFLAGLAATVGSGSGAGSTTGVGSGAGTGTTCHCFAAPSFICSAMYDGSDLARLTVGIAKIARPASTMTIRRNI
ncbi:MAG: hypothetical protein DCC49_12335 [Acidobacteria bacterium]|nr:MAG: hypothetical protein DCC49_12335 [Acidobacteriota bacterium]